MGLKCWHGCLMLEIRLFCKRRTHGHALRVLKKTQDLCLKRTLISSCRLLSLSTCLRFRYYRGWLKKTMGLWENCYDLLVCLLCGRKRMTMRKEIILHWEKPHRDGSKKALIARGCCKHLLLKIQGNVCKHCNFAYCYRVPQIPP